MKKFLKTLGIVVVTLSMIVGLCYGAMYAVNAAELSQENFIDGFSGDKKANKKIDKELVEETVKDIEAFKKQKFYLKLVKDTSAAKNCLAAIEAEYPELYQYTINGVSGGQSMWLGNFLVFSSFDYTMSQSKYKKSLKKIRKIKNEIVQATSGMSDYEKEIYVYNYIARNCTYKSKTPLDSTIYGVFINKKANCTGLAKAFKYLMNACGVECVQMGGYENKSSGHAWNKVKINGKWYVVDLTKEVNFSEETENGKDGLIYLSFNVTDSGYSDTYIPDNIFYNAPASDSTEMNYHVVNGLYFDGSNLEVVLVNLDKLLQENGGGSVKCSGENTLKTLTDSMGTLQDIHYENTDENIGLNYWSINDSCVYVKIDRGAE